MPYAASVSRDALTKHLIVEIAPDFRTVFPAVAALGAEKSKVTGARLRNGTTDLSFSKQSISCILVNVSLIITHRLTVNVTMPCNAA